MAHRDAELKLRSLAIEWYQQGTPFTAICQRLQRSHRWLAKWLRRFQTAGWTALVSCTRGVESPFIAGLWLEIVLSAMTVAPRGTVVVTGSAVAALWLQQMFLGLGGALSSLVLQSGFLFGM